MTLRPATQTNEMLLPEGAERIERDGYHVLRTPAKADYWLANRMVLDSPPAEADLPMWIERFDREFSGLPVLKRYFSWETDGEETWQHGELPEGLEYCPELVLTTRKPPPATSTDGGLAVARLDIEADRQEILDYYITVYGGLMAELSDLPVREMEPTIELKDGVARVVDIHRHAFAQHDGGWWVARDGDANVASLGLLMTPNLCRFREPFTLSEARGRGACSALITAALSEALQRYPDATAVILPQETGSPADRLFRKLGFAPAGFDHILIGPAAGSESEEY